MWVRTMSLLPRVRVSCERCAVLAAGPTTVSSKTTLLSVSNDNSFRQLSTVPIASVPHRQKRFLHAAVSGAAGQGCRQTAAVTAPLHRLNHQQQQERQPLVPAAPDNVYLLHQNSENPQELCRDFLANICDDIKSELNTSMPPLRDLAHYLFDGKGKYVRPQIVFLLAIVANKTVLHDGNAGSEVLAAAEAAASNSHITPISPLLITERQKSVCRIAEMIHTASLIHDDVIDGSSVRRGHPTIHSLWGESKAVITGDYILSVASHCLSETKNPRVVEIISQVVEDLVRGEFMQLGTKTDETLRFNHYLEKTYRKTASLLANCCKAAAVLAECGEERVEAAFQYGRNIGIAFQLVDDLLDFISTDEALGKPAAADLNLGLATAPVLFALDRHPDLAALIVRRFSKPGDVVTALNCVRDSDGVDQTKFLAAKFSREAAKNLDLFVDSNHRRALKTLTDKMLHRLH